MSQKADELKKVYENLDSEAKESISKLKTLIEKNAMTPEQVELLITHAHQNADERYPELDEMDRMSSAEFAEMYKKMADDIKEAPEKYENHAKASGMTPDELAGLFSQINGAVVRYPEVWESKENAQMLHPRNLAILVNVFKKDKEEE